jgi:hypothetical protein
MFVSDVIVDLVEMLIHRIPFKSNL